MNTKHTPEQLIERIMFEFNMTDETYDSLPRGLASELNALLAQRNELLEACQTVAEKLETTGEYPAMLAMLNTALEHAKAKEGAL